MDEALRFVIFMMAGIFGFFLLYKLFSTNNFVYAILVFVDLILLGVLRIIKKIKLY